MRFRLLKAAAFAVKAMESVRLCEECDECSSRCSYRLPIPEILKKHLAIYDEHRQEKVAS